MLKCRGSNLAFILDDSFLDTYFFLLYMPLLLCSDTERSQIAYVTFKDSQGAETAMLLSVI